MALDLEMLTTIYRFNTAANEHVRDAMARAGEEATRRGLDLWYGSMFALAAHIAGAETIWLSRLRDGVNLSRLPSAEDFDSLDALVARWREMDAACEAYAQSLTSEEATGTFSYRNTSGTEFTAPRWQPLLQVPFHSAEHRAQITVALSRMGIAHGTQDFIYTVLAR